MKRDLLDASMIQDSLAHLDGWHVEGHELVREFRFVRYWAGIEFVNHTARLAEEMNHHPEMLIGWKKVTVRLTTHDSGGLTALDVELARRISSLLR
jgi:4a-hydroxytetrahydrobiopterin dehydratase